MIEPNNKHKTLRFLAIAVASANTLAIIVLAVTSLTQSYLPRWAQYNTGSMTHNYVSALVMILGALVGLFLNNRNLTTTAGYVVVLSAFVGTTIAYLPESVASHEAIIFTPSILLSSILLTPAHSFIMATMCSLVIGIVDTQVLNTNVDPFSVLVMFVVATFSWLSTKLLEDAIVDHKQLNKKLQTKIEAQHKELIQIVGDLAFLVDKRENAIVLYGPDRNVLFANKLAVRARGCMDDKALSAYEAAVERAWKKNISTRINTDTFIADIVSSLIDTDKGTYLLIQAVRLPDEESKHSLEDWQRKLTAANNLPENTEFDPQTYTMRATERENGNFRKKVIFELDPDGHMVIENPLNRRQKLLFRLKDLLILAIRGESQ